jgi:hypothetical protein
MIAETHVFTPALLNEFRAGFDRVSEGVYQQDIGHQRQRRGGIADDFHQPARFRTQL